MKKILFFFNTSEDFLGSRLSLLLAVNNAGYEVSVAMPDIAAIQVKQYPQFQFFELSLDRQSTGLFSQIKTLYGIYKISLHVKPDLLFLFRVKIVLLGALVARLTRKKMLCVFTGLGYVFSSVSSKARLIKKCLICLYQLILPKENQSVIFQNPDDREAFIHLGIITEAHSAVILGSGVDIEKFMETDESSHHFVKVLLLSRMLWDKGIGEFVDAVRLLKNKKLPVEFILAGGVDLKATTAIPKETLLQWQSEGLVTWLDHVTSDKIPALLASVNIVCLPSYAEGLPRVLLEGAASGRALIAADVPGCREVVRNGENGLLVPVKNAQALADAIEKLVLDAELRQKMGKRSRELAEQLFSKDVIIQQYLALIQAQML
jgi:glycosyltransferase involved in cell wall biosynthesis